MSQSVRNQKFEQKKKEQHIAIRNNNRCLMLSVLAVALIPLLVQIVTDTSGLSSYDWFSKNDNEVDFFLIYKMYAIIAVAVIMLVVLLVKLYNYSSDFITRIGANKIIFYALALYAVTAIASAAFANNVSVAFKGGYAQHEPVFVLIGYCTMLIFAYIYVQDIKNIKFLLKCIMIGVALISFLGVLQWAAADFFTTYAGKSLISTFSSIKASQISLSFEVGRVYMTLYNPNYVGSYVALVLPVMAAGIYIMDKMWEKAVIIITVLMLIICLIGSGSTTGMTAILVSLILFFIICIPMLSKYRKQLIITAAAAFVIIIAVGCINRDKIADAVNKYRLTEDNYSLDGIMIHDDSVEIDYKGDKIFARSELYNGNIILSLFDADMKPLKSQMDEATGNIKISDNEFYSSLSFSGVDFGDKTYGFKFVCDGKEYMFTNDNEKKKYYFLNIYGKTTNDIVKADSIGFDNHEQFASNRGFIWSRSIPLLKDNLIIGCGPDNFIHEFPNNDYVSLMNNDYAGEVVTRPHNMYLQIGVQTGVISLIAFLTIYGVYFVQSIRLFWRTRIMTVTYIAGLSVCIGSFGYMICGLANDSSVCTAPVFWTLLGIGLACNQLLKKQISLD